MAAMEEAETSLTLMPTHDNGDELVAALLEHGFEATKLPARFSPEAEQRYLEGKEKHKAKKGKEEKQIEKHYGICENDHAVKEAEDFGLSAGAAVCPTCSYNTVCDYLMKREIAMRGAHLVATHHMFVASQGKLAQGRGFVAVHEDAKDMLSPMLTVSEHQLRGIAAVAAEAKHQEKQRRPEHIRMDCIEVFDVIADTVADLLYATDQAERTSEFFPSSTVKLPSVIQARLFRACKLLISRAKEERSEQGSERDLPKNVDARAMKLVLGLVSGKLHHCFIKVDQPKKLSKREEPHKSILAVWRTVLPSNVPVVFSDATGSAAQIELLTGRPVRDITPPGLLAAQQLEIQFTHDIKRATKLTTVTRLLGAASLRYPQATRVGLIGHKPHIEALTTDGGSLGSLQTRIANAAYFGQGIDRASNNWQEDCDLLIILGTPRVRPEAIQNELLRVGDLESAEQDGGWGPYRWTAATVSGGRRVISGIGYKHPRWRVAYEIQVTAALSQAIGRARSNLDDGIPVVVFSNENVGLPVSDEADDLHPLTKSALDRYEWFEGEVAKSLNNILYSFCNFRTGDMATHWGWKTPDVSRVLGQLATAGYLTKLEQGTWAVTSLLTTSKEAVPG